MTTKHRRVLVKISGQALAGPDAFGLDSDALRHIAGEILEPHQAGVEVGVMVGGGNIFRGSVADAWGIDRAEADHVGMLGTAINALVLRGVLTAMGSADVRVMTALPIEAVAEPYIRLRAIRHLEKGRIILFGCGTGQPFVTTDYPAVQRAAEIGASAVLVAKNGVDGVYSADPEVDPDAEFVASATYDEVIRRNIKVMDQAAFILAKECELPIYVFNIQTKGCVAEICAGGTVGTMIHA